MELGVRIHLAFVTDDRDGLNEGLAGFGLTPEEARNLPHALCGTLDQIVQRFLAGPPERFGISNIGLSASSLDELAPVITSLAGT